MRLTPAGCTFLVLACVSLALPHSLRADTIGLNASAGFQANSPALGQYNSNSISVPLTMTPIVLDPFSGSTPDANAFASGTVKFGSITGEAYAAATGNGGAAAAQFQGAWQDSLMVTSATLARGTPVQLRFTLITNGSIACTGPLHSASFNASFSFTTGSGPVTQGTTCNTSISDSVPLTLSTFVGADIAVEGQLTEQATASNIGTASSADVDPPSAQFFIDSETTGATYTTGSGNTYFSPVSAAATPEPSSLALLGTGLMGLAAASWLPLKSARN